MRKHLFMFILLSTLFITPASATKISINVDSNPVDIPVTLYNSTSYVPIRAFFDALYPSANISWKNREAIVIMDNLTITARPKNIYMLANDRILFVRDGIKLINGSTMIPIRVLAKAINSQVTWEDSTKTVYLDSSANPILSGDHYYKSDELYWLSHIIHAESAGESLIGKIAVGNVILNRVESTHFPKYIYSVIHDNKWGTQFEPISNGSINNTPNEESILAAKLCLEGAKVVGDSLYFLNQEKSNCFWIVENRSYVTTIGNHQFYE